MPSRIGRALHSAVNQVPLTDPFFEDGKIHLDNKALENKIRPHALGIKNFLFTGSYERTKRIAKMYSFNKIGNYPINKRYELLPFTVHSIIVSNTHLL
jgi:hypothetical protein